MPNDPVPDDETLFTLEDLWALRKTDSRTGDQLNAAITTAYRRGQEKPSTAAQLAMLKKWFPWLGDDESVDGADVVQRLNEWFGSVGGTTAAPKEATEEDPSHAIYRAAAEKKWSQDGECEVDEGATVSPSDDAGAYIQAWVWVSDEDAGIKTKCRTCKEEIENGDGFDGECGSCVEKGEEADES